MDTRLKKGQDHNLIDEATKSVQEADENAELSLVEKLMFFAVTLIGLVALVGSMAIIWK